MRKDNNNNSIFNNDYLLYDENEYVFDERNRSDDRFRDRLCGSDRECGELSIIGARDLCCEPNRSNKQMNFQGCCCKRGLKNSLDILLNPVIKNLVNLFSFTLVGEDFSTLDGATTLKTVSNCPDELITYSDPSDTEFTSTTLCDLVVVAFCLLPDPTANPEITNRTRFIACIRRMLPSVNPKSLCCKENAECCCNISKALFLANAVGPVNIKVKSSAFTSPFIGYTVITVTDNIAWLINNSNRVIIVCLSDIQQLG